MHDKNYVNIKLFDLPISERPRERLLKYGCSTLSDVELLALLLRSGGKGSSVRLVAEDLLRKFKSFKGLMLADIAEIMSYKSVGLAKATSIKAACEIGLRLSSDTINTNILVTNPVDIYNLVRQSLFAKTKEYLYVLSLDARLRVMSTDLVSIGTINETLAHPREVYSIAVRKCAVSIVIAHNHPSNDPTPSSADIEFTKRLTDAGKVLGIKLQDHIIVCDSGFNSLKEMGFVL